VIADRLVLDSDHIQPSFAHAADLLVETRLNGPGSPVSIRTTALDRR
jgi:hypothetical protein